MTDDQVTTTNTITTPRAELLAWHDVHCIFAVVDPGGLLRSRCPDRAEWAILEQNRAHGVYHPMGELSVYCDAHVGAAVPADAEWVQAQARSKPNLTVYSRLAAAWPHAARIA